LKANALQESLAIAATLKNQPLDLGLNAGRSLQTNDAKFASNPLSRFTPEPTSGMPAI